ncbi:hypothetical protein ACFVDI_08400 [Nocardioides sp. NPDC057767]|uniref:hypothetical protein n=1 Tax=Nocardioides sp. NPDC057767 TaxID=3346244 RepID=UPI003672CDA7
MWIGDGSDPAHYAGLNADHTLCGQPNAGSSWTWDYPDLSTPVCPTCRAKAAGL